MGREKGLAYRGVRQPALNAIIHAFSAVQPLPDETDEQRAQRAESIVRAKRQFVSEVQTALQAAGIRGFGIPHEEQP